MLYSLDRFEGSVALCEGEDGVYLTLNRELLPPDALEGDLLVFQGERWLIDREATALRKSILMQKREKLTNPLHRSKRKRIGS